MARRKGRRNLFYRLKRRRKSNNIDSNFDEVVPQPDELRESSVSKSELLSTEVIAVPVPDSVCFLRDHDYYLSAEESVTNEFPPQSECNSAEIIPTQSVGSPITSIYVQYEAHDRQEEVEILDMNCEVGLEVEVSSIAGNENMGNQPEFQDDVTVSQELQGDLWKVLQSQLTPALPQMWVPIQKDNYLQLSLLSDSSPAMIQRSLTFFATGDLQIAAHGRDLHPDHYFWKQIPQFPALCRESSDCFYECILQTLSRIRLMEICVGVNDSSLSEWWKRTKNSCIDDNIFKEKRYETCCRSNQCLYLVPQQSQRCRNCAALIKVMRKRSKRFSKKLKEGTPRKKKPDSCLTTPELKARSRRRIKTGLNLKRQNVRLREKITLLLSKDGVTIDEELSNELSRAMKGKGLSEFQKLFLEQQVQCSGDGSLYRRRWHPSMIRFALDVYLHSATAYDVLKRYVTLPSKRTLYDYSHVEKLEEGLCMSSIEDLGRRTSSMEEYQTYHILYYDEVFISRNLVYNKNSGELVGYCKLNEVQREMKDLEIALETDSGSSSVAHPPIATKILTFMANGVSSGLCEVVASYSVSCLTKEDLFHHHWQVVEALETTGVRIIASVGDGSSVNRSFIDMHEPLTKVESQVIFDTQNMFDLKRPFYFFSDAPHLLKTIRNCFSSPSRKLYKNNQSISWSTILRLYHSTKSETIRKAYKLNAQCVYLTPYSRMRVIYAARVMSKSVANALKDKGWLDIEETIKFIELVDRFFDCLNGNYSSEGKRKRKEDLKPYTSVEDSRFEFLLEFLNYFKEWEREVSELPISAAEKAKCQLSAQTLKGIEITVRSFIKCVQFLLNIGTKFINARVFCQDLLEHYFSRQRAKCGGSTNPNVSEFFRNQNTFKILGSVGVNRKKSNIQVYDSGPKVDATPLKKRKDCPRKSLNFSQASPVS